MLASEGEYRILSLDGGGTWALIEARTLIALFGDETKGHDVLKHFDLVAANSGGSIVLAGLLANMRLCDIRQIFENSNLRRQIFSRTDNILYRLMRLLTGMGPKYSTSKKLCALTKILDEEAGKWAGDGFGGRNLKVIADEIAEIISKEIHIIVVGFDYYRNRATFFRSKNISGDYGVGHVSQAGLAAAVHASTNAPIQYFDAPAALGAGFDLYWDGAISGNNNPVLAACIEAVCLGKSLENLKVISIGTATKALPLAVGGSQEKFCSVKKRKSLYGDIKKISQSILDDPPDFATFAAHVITGGKQGLPNVLHSRVVRFNPMISPIRRNGRWSAPTDLGENDFAKICKMGMDAVTNEEVRLINNLFVSWTSGNTFNQPIRSARLEDLKTVKEGKCVVEAEIGYIDFEEAKDAYDELFKAPKTGAQ